MKRATKHSRGTDKDLQALCDQIGGVLKKRDGELWLEPFGLQLTYRYYDLDGKREKGTDEKRMEVARKILGDILEARANFTPVQQRLNRLINRVRDEHVNYQRETFMHIREPSLDQAVLFSAGGHCTVWLELVGRERLEVRSTSFLKCCDLLREKGIPQEAKKGGGA